jgi:large subunit ribosomal protein L29
MADKENYSAMSKDELKGAISTLKRELLNLRFQQASGELENTARFRVVRRNIARANTALKALNIKAAA